MFVFRIENERGNGPYIGSAETSILLRSHNSSDYHSSATLILNDDNRLSLFRCGFTSIDLLNKWFDGHLDMLDKYSFGISVYEIEDYFVITDDKQVLFPVELADKIETIKTNDIENYKNYKPRWPLLNGVTCSEKQRSDFLLEVMGELLFRQKQEIKDLKNENSRINRIKNKLEKGRTTHGISEIAY